ncbi:MAG: hypothetical protein QOG94_2870 [Solirubrobacteraceae bacterium]|nr:hypothetical protein [Solirubrobacteraceae bacterium]
MELPVAIILLLITLIVLALAVFLIATIVELGKINAGLASVLDGVGEIATKTAPVNGVLDAINGTLVAGRNLLEGLALKKAGPDAAGLVESCFPGEGQRFLARIGRSGTIVPFGEDYPRGAAILGSLLGGPAPPSPGEAQAAAAAAPAAPRSGRISLRKPSPAAVAPPTVPGRLSAKGSRPWE